MKKTLVLTSMLAIALLLTPASASYAGEKDANGPETLARPPFSQEMPKLYDKNGKELKNPPKPGEKVYDKNGKELPPPPFMKRAPKGPDLNLTDEQKAKADKIREASRQKMKPIRREIHNLKNEIWEIKENDKLTFEEKEGKIRPLFEKINKLQEKSNEIRQEDMKQFEALLTKTQKKTLENFKKTHKPPRQHDRDRKMPPPPCFED